MNRGPVELHKAPTPRDTLTLCANDAGRLEHVLALARLLADGLAHAVPPSRGQYELRLARALAFEVVELLEAAAAS